MDFILNEKKSSANLAAAAARVQIANTSENFKKSKKIGKN
jgi:hypothetical protein